MCATMRKAGFLNLTLFYSHTNLLLEGMGKTHVICIWLVVFVNRVEDSIIPVKQLVRILMTFQRLSKGTRVINLLYVELKITGFPIRYIRVLKSLYDFLWKK